MAFPPLPKQIKISQMDLALRLVLLRQEQQTSGETR